RAADGIRTFAMFIGTSAGISLIRHSFCVSPRCPAQISVEFTGGNPPERRCAEPTPGAGCAPLRPRLRIFGVIFLKRPAANGKVDSWCGIRCLATKRSLRWEQPIGKEFLLSAE